MATSLAVLDHDQTFGPRTRRRTDTTIAKHVAILEGVAKANGGVLPPYKWLNKHGYFYSYDIMREYPAAFAHIKTTQDKKFEIYGAQKDAQAKGVGQILPPAKVKTLAEYQVPGATFNPTSLLIEPGTAESDWMQIGRALAAVCQSAYWWVGDWIQYGFTTYGKKTTFDLAQQATGYTRTQLYDCSSIAKRFPPERRVGALTFFHHRSVAKYPPAVADKVLAEAAELGLTGRQAADAAAEEVGQKKPEREVNGRRRITITLWLDTYDVIKQHAQGKATDWYIAQIVEDWATQKQRGKQ